MPADEKTYLKNEIARLKEAVRGSESMQIELKDLAQKSRNARDRKSREDEFKRQQQTTSNLKYSIAELETALKALK